MNVVWVLIGAVLLYAGGEALVRGARDLALRLGIPPLVIGLTVVAFGTSMPELAATLTAALEDAPEVAFGNVVGSNIANIGLALGLAAVMASLPVRGRFLAREMPFMLASSVLAMFFAWDGLIDRTEGLVLLAVLGLFLFFLLRTEKEPEPDAVSEEFAREFSGSRALALWTQVAKIVIGVGALTLGAKALVSGGVGIARAFAVDERVIGLTLVAVGTSLPEVASTIVAALRREGDIVIGNLIGSNVFNVLFILGATVLVEPIAVERATAEVDLAVMLGFSVLTWPLMISRRRLDRWEGVLLLALYAAYVASLFVRT